MIAVCAVASLLGGCASAPVKEAPVMSRSYAFWPPAPAEPRIQFLRSFALSTDVNPIRQSALERVVFGDDTERAVAIGKPYGVAMRDGKIYVCDTREARVAVLDLARREMRLMGASGLNSLQLPVDVAVADDGFLYVADRTRGIMVFTPGERFVNAFTTQGMRPIGVAVHGSRLYIADMSTQGVLVMDRHSGALLDSIGTVGDEDGQFRLPLGLAVDAGGDLHVVDVMRCRLQRFSTEGRFRAGVGTMSDTTGNFVRPKHIAVDREGLVYVVDAAFQNVQVFDNEYRLLTSFGGAGAHPGAMNMPAGVFVLDEDVELFRDQIHPYFNARRLILVTNQFGPFKVAVYAFGELRPGRTVQDVMAYAAAMEPDILAPGDINPLSDPPPDFDPVDTDADDPADGSAARSAAAKDGR